MHAPQLESIPTRRPLRSHAFLRPRLFSASYTPLPPSPLCALAQHELNLHSFLTQIAAARPVHRTQRFPPAQLPRTLLLMAATTASSTSVCARTTPAMLLPTPDSSHGTNSVSISCTQIDDTHANTLVNTFGQQSNSRAQKCHSKAFRIPGHFLRAHLDEWVVEEAIVLQVAKHVRDHVAYIPVREAPRRHLL